MAAFFLRAHPAKGTETIMFQALVTKLAMGADMDWRIVLNQP
jgi:hypothetical protein